MLDYSNKLVQLYKTQNVLGFFQKVSFSKTKSALKLNQEINRVLEKLDQKFVIFIDDLDRLSGSETLQVLKLIRNTANFRNFIFFIALDKDYVLRTLKSEKIILDHTYLDKFFQLEIYLPQIDNDKLKNYFITLISESNALSDMSFKDEVKEALKSNTDLFNEYIKDFRSVKRLANQIFFDLPIIPDDLNTENFLNFQYLKITFPGMIKFLNNNWNEVLDIDVNNMRVLIGSNKEDEEQNSVSEDWSNGDFLFNRNFIPNFNDYDLTKNLEIYLKNDDLGNYSRQQYKLIKKSLIVLFGKENPANDYTSIKYGDNLRKLLLQETKENELSNREFIDLLSVDLEQYRLYSLKDEGKLDEVIDRIKFYNPQSIQQLGHVLRFLITVYRKAEEFSVNQFSVLSTLKVFLNANIKGEGKNSKFLKQIIEEYLISEKENKFSRLELILFLFENKSYIGLSSLEFKVSDLKTQSLEIYKQIIDEYKNSIWAISDFRIYHAYHNVVKLNQRDVANDLFKTLWNKSNIKLFCAQMLKHDTWAIKFLSTSEFVENIFGNKWEYYQFVAKFENKNDSELNDYLDFLKVESFTNFKHYVMYEFTEFDLANQRIQFFKSSYSQYTEHHDNEVEIFWKSANQGALSATITNIGNDVFSSLITNEWFKTSREELYTRSRLKHESVEDNLKAALKHYRKNLRDYPDAKINFQKYEITNDDQVLIKLVSKQPTSFFK